MITKLFLLDQLKIWTSVKVIIRSTSSWLHVWGRKCQIYCGLLHCHDLHVNFLFSISIQRFPLAQLFVAFNKWWQNSCWWNIRLGNIKLTCVIIVSKFRKNREVPVIVSTGEYNQYGWENSLNIFICIWEECYWFNYFKGLFCKHSY